MSLNVGGIYIKVKKGITKQKAIEHIHEFYLGKGATQDNGDDLLTIAPLSLKAKKTGRLAYAVASTNTWVAIYDSERYTTNILLAKYLAEALNTTVLFYIMYGATDTGEYRWFGKRSSKKSVEVEDEDSYAITEAYLEDLSLPYPFLYFSDLNKESVDQEEIQLIGFEKVTEQMYQTEYCENSIDGSIIEDDSDSHKEKRVAEERKSCVQAGLLSWSLLKNKDYRHPEYFPTLEEDFIQTCKTSYNGYTYELYMFVKHLYEQQECNIVSEIIEKVFTQPIVIEKFKWYDLWANLLLDQGEIDKSVPVISLALFFGSCEINATRIGQILLKYYEKKGDLEKAGIVFHGANEIFVSFREPAVDSYGKKKSNWYNRFADIYLEFVHPVWDVKCLTLEELSLFAEEFFTRLNEPQLLKTWLKEVENEITARKKIFETDIPNAANLGHSFKLKQLLEWIPVTEDDMVINRLGKVAFKELNKNVGEISALLYRRIIAVPLDRYGSDNQRAFDYFHYLTLLFSLDREEGIRVLPKALGWGPDYPGIFYIAACFWAESDPDEALNMIALAKKYHYPTFYSLPADPKLAALSAMPGFHQLFEHDNELIEVCDEDGVLIIREGFSLVFFFRVGFTKIAEGVTQMFERWLSFIDPAVLKWALIGANATCYKAINKNVLNVCRKLISQKGKKAELVWLNVAGENVQNPDYCFIVNGQNNKKGDQRSWGHIEMRFPNNFFDMVDQSTYIQFCRDMASLIPFDSGYSACAAHCGEFSVVHTQRDQILERLSQKYAGMNIADNEKLAYHIQGKSIGPRWLTFLSTPQVKELGGEAIIKKQLDNKIQMEPVKNGILLRTNERITRLANQNDQLETLGTLLDSILYRYEKDDENRRPW